MNRISSNFLFSFRNRFAERSEFLLPLNDDAEIEHFNFNPRALAVMRKNKTTELPPQFPMRLRGTQYRRSRQYLECYGFVLENEFPNSVALLTTGEVILCVEFREPEEPGEAYVITGLKFEKVEPLFLNPNNSRDLGLVTVSGLEFVKKNYSSDLLVAKCFVFAHPTNIEPTKCSPIPDELNDALMKKNSAEFKDLAESWVKSDVGCRTRSYNKWDVYSIEVPGRHAL